MSAGEASTFTFEEQGHTYREDGVVRLSATQCIEIAGISDYSMVPPEYLIPAQQRGTRVHGFTAYMDARRLGLAYDGALPEIEEGDAGYVDAWDRYLRESGFKIRAVEQRMIGACKGIRYGVTLDREGFRGRWPALVELKTTAQAHPGFGVQLALQEMALRKCDLRIGHYLRCAVQLFPDGRYKEWPFYDALDALIAEKALAFANGIGNTDRHWEDIQTWLRNHNLAA